MDRVIQPPLVICLSTFTAKISVLFYIKCHSFVFLVMESNAKLGILCIILTLWNCSVLMPVSKFVFLGCSCWVFFSNWIPIWLVRCLRKKKSIMSNETTPIFKYFSEIGKCTLFMNGVTCYTIIMLVFILLSADPWLKSL